MKKKLLLADDSITIQKVVGIIFANESYELLTASDGDKAFDLALTHKPDLVIADIVMPGKNGFELCQEIKSHPALETTSVLLLPGAFEEFDETRAVEVCADGWLTKPFESQALIDKVTVLLAMPPLRLVASAQAAEDEMAAETAAAEQLAPVVADVTLETEEEDFFTVAEPDDDHSDAANETSAAANSSDNELWGEVSFEEEDLKPQELLAASDQNEEESAEFAAEEDDPYQPAQALTPEQLAPYMSTPAALPQEEQGSPDVEPLSAETDQDFEFIGDQPDDEDENISTEADFAGAAQMTEAAPSVEFVAEDGIEDDSDRADTTAESDDVSNDVFELMEEDLEQAEELLEDPATFIDMSAADEVFDHETSAEADIDLTPEDELSADNEILDLTEVDVFEEEETLVAAPLEEPPVQADIDEGEFLYEESPEQIIDEDEPVETGSFDAAAFAAPAAPAAPAVPAVLADPAHTASSAETVEQQLRQLPEEEIVQIVEKVAGPLIERLTREMLEQVVWEVVPDLAETMIRSEIEKIKRGEA